MGPGFDEQARHPNYQQRQYPIQQSGDAQSAYPSPNAQQYVAQGNAQQQYYAQTRGLHLPPPAQSGMNQPQLPFRNGPPIPHSAHIMRPPSMSNNQNSQSAPAINPLFAAQYQQMMSNMGGYGGWQNGNDNGGRPYNG
jgi:hypothetical protein